MQNNKKTPEKTLQPSPEFLDEHHTSKETKVPVLKHEPIMASEMENIYPAVNKRQSQENASGNPYQQYAKAMVADSSVDYDKPISFRVKSLLIYLAFALISIMINLMQILTSEASGTILLLLATTIDLAAAIYLLLSKNQSAVTLLLRILIIFRLVSLPFTILNPIVFGFSLIVTSFLYYAYVRVKTLR